MRVLHFLPVYLPAWQFGGPILSVSRLCEALIEHGVDVRVITTNAGLPDFPQDQLSLQQYVNGVPVTYYPIDRQSRTIRSRALLKALPQHMNWAQLLHLSSVWQPTGLQVQKAAHNAGLPVIQTLRGALGPYSWQSKWWKKIPYYIFKEWPMLQKSAFLHCTSSQEVSELKRLFLSSPVRVLPNPVDLSRFYQDRLLGKSFRLRIGIPLDVPLLLVVGRQHHKKGLDLLPAALRPLRQLPWNILFVGEDGDGTGQVLRNSFSQAGLQHRCFWIKTMPAENLVSPYNAAD